MARLPLTFGDTNAMPMGQTTQLPIDESGFSAPVNAPAAAPPAASGMVAPPAAMPAAAPDTMQGRSAFNPPGYPPQHGYDISMQPDGSAVWYVNTPGGQVVVDVAKAPKIPPALQAQNQAPTKAMIAGQ